MEKFQQFTIGEQYDNYEFDITFIKIIIENNIEYVVYHYKKEEKHFLFNIKITGGVFLWFNADILMKVEYVLTRREYEYIRIIVNKFDLKNIVITIIN